MSSKVQQPDETSGIEPLVWRQMHAAGPTSPGADSETAPDSRQRLAQLKQQYEESAQEAHEAGLREGEAAGRGQLAAEMRRKPGTDTEFPAQFAGNWLSVPGFAPRDMLPVRRAPKNG
jgi:hypothetical protein